MKVTRTGMDENQRVVEFTIQDGSKSLLAKFLIQDPPVLVELGDKFESTLASVVKLTVKILNSNNFMAEVEKVWGHQIPYVLLRYNGYDLKVDAKSTLELVASEYLDKIYSQRQKKLQ